MRFALVGILIAGCGNSSSSGGLPPATDWAADDPSGGVALERPKAPTKTKNPHDGVPGAPMIPDEEAEPEAEEGAAVEDLPPGHVPIEPSEPADPAHRVRGTLKLGAKAAGRVKPDGVIFLIAKTPDAKGQPTGSALAVDRVIWKSDGQAFEIGGATGDVVVLARYDTDGDGSSTTAGDVIGMTRVKVPADNVVIELSTVVE